MLVVTAAADIDLMPVAPRSWPNASVLLYVLARYCAPMDVFETITGEIFLVAVAS